MSTRKKAYRTKKERQANSAEMKKGSPLEVYELLSVGELAERTDVGDATKVLILSVGQGEACRDMNDVEAVLLEKDITGTFIPMRRAGEPIGRFIQTVVGFVTPKSDPIYKEETAKKTTKKEEE